MDGTSQGLSEFRKVQSEGIVTTDYLKDKFSKTYEISLCCGSGLIQYVNITPSINMEEGKISGN